MGSTTHIVDEAGAVRNRYEYDAWGNITAQEEAVPNRFKFTGQQLDPVTQQYYLRARFYNPVVARFTQEDTYRGDGLNLYTYCANSPVRYVDPSGYHTDCINKDALRIAQENGRDTPNKDDYATAYRNQAYDRATAELVNNPNLSAREKYELTDRINRIKPGDIPQADVPTASGGFLAQQSDISTSGAGTTPDFYHYTNSEGARAIQESGKILPDDRGRVFVTTDEISPQAANNALFMGTKDGDCATHRVEIKLTDQNDPRLTSDGATQPNELIYRGTIRNGRNATFTVKENDFE